MHYVWEEIQPEIDSLRPLRAWLTEIKMYETPTSFATLSRKQWAIEQRLQREPSLLVDITAKAADAGSDIAGGE